MMYFVGWFSTCGVWHHWSEWSLALTGLVVLVAWAACPVAWCHARAPIHRQLGLLRKLNVVTLAMPS